MINTNRPRNDEEDNNQIGSPKNSQTEDFKELYSTVFNFDHSNKLHCQFCKKDITKSVKIVCAVCPKTFYCLECLISCKGADENVAHKHDYYVIDKLAVPFFTNEWSTHEEMLLLAGIEKCGLDNWQDISEIIGSKSKLQSEAHYYSFYLTKTSQIPSEKDVIIRKSSGIDQKKDQENKERNENILNELKEKQGTVPETTNKESRFSSSRSIIKNRNRKDQNINTNTSAKEILGYWPKREDFDIEYLNDAELEIAELEFQDDITPLEKELKLNMLKVYSAELEERERRKKFIIENNLLDIKKTMNYERKLQKDDREILNCLKPFARFLQRDQFQEFFEGLILEKNLKLRISQLKAYKKMGLKTYEDIEKHLEMDNNKCKKDDKKSLILFENNGIGAKVSKFLRGNNNSENEGINGLSEKERGFIKSLSLKREVYTDIKSRILKEMMNYKDPEKISISKNISQYYDLDKDRLNEVLEFVMKQAS